MRRLLLGRPADSGKPVIIGLYGFAERLRDIWDAANKADPFAAWWLIKIEQARDTAREKIDIEKSSVLRAIESMPEFDIQFAADVSLEGIELRFACPYAYQVARVLKMFDELVLAANVAVQIGVKPSASSSRNRFRCERSIRHLLASAHGFYSLGLKTADIQQQTDVASQARELMGEIPADILSGARRPELLKQTSVSTLSVDE